MGLENREGGNWITIYNGKFSQKVQENVAGAVQRTNKLGKTVHEKFYDSFTGKLVNIRTQDGSYGRNWIFDFRDNGEVFHLNLGYSNSFATAFLKMLPNIDVTKEMQVSPSVKEVDGKNRSSLFVKQGDNWIKSAYTKENPNGMPDLKQVKIKGQLAWDDTERMEFLEAMVNEEILPKLPKDLPVSSQTKADSDVDEFANDMKADKPSELDDF